MIELVRPDLGDEEIRAVAEVLRSRQLAAGPRVRAFEEAFAAYVGCRYAVATSSGTTALHAALQAIGVGPGDQVVTSPFTFVATANAILYCGAEPVFADIDPATFNLSVESLAEALERHPRIRAVVVVHLFGLPCPMDAIVELAHRKGVAVVEDCAQAHGATWRGRRVGGFGLAGAFSFYATKNMTTGEGGMVTTDAPEVARRLRELVNHGRIGPYEHGSLGYNYRMTDLAAAIGLVQLARLEKNNERRRANAEMLSRGLAGLPWLELPVEPPGARHVYHQYTVRSPHRDALQRWLAARGIQTAVIYPIPLHLQPFYRTLGFEAGLAPWAERVAGEVLSLPVHPLLRPEELQIIIEAVRSFEPPGEAAPARRASLPAYPAARRIGRPPA